jgi:peptidoglycan/xylan/chitin deacetylase (PgdA/CDA1 family)
MSPALIVMYHYVRPDQGAIPAGIRPLLTSEFETQLDWLGERYEIVKPDDFLKRLAGWSLQRPPVAAEATTPLGPGSKPMCLLTFDDGTKDHAEVVTPILHARGLTGVFFILSGPAERGIMPLTHAIHWLLGGDESRVWDLFQQHAGQPLGDAAEAQRIYRYETPLRARIKYAANMVLPNQVTERIVRAAVAVAGRSMEDLAREWFVSADDIRAMDSAGMTISMHGVSHRSLQSLGPVGIREEISHCSSYLKNLTGKLPTWYACPFGGTGSSVESLQAMRTAMRDAGVVASVSTEKSHVLPGTDRFALPRFDTIDLPPRGGRMQDRTFRV